MADNMKNSHRRVTLDVAVGLAVGLLVGLIFASLMWAFYASTIWAFHNFGGFVAAGVFISWFAIPFCVAWQISSFREENQ